MRPVRLMLAAALFAGATAQSVVAGSNERVIAMLELFTSQGCSSCPAADAVLGELSKRDDVIALSLPVDYWDYLGWKDSLANPEFSKRQRDYAKHRGDGRVYTPQVVVNGYTHVIGSSKKLINTAIVDAPRVNLAVQIEAHRMGGMVRVRVRDAVNAGGGEKGDTIWLASVRPEVAVQIKRGENQGRTLTYYNVVRKLIPIGALIGNEANIALPYGEMMQEGERCVVFVQNGQAGPIIAATWMSSRSNQQK